MRLFGLTIPPRKKTDEEIVAKTRNGLRFSVEPFRKQHLLVACWDAAQTLKPVLPAQQDERVGGRSRQPK
ncbi:MAG: hypothetical protein H7A46_23025 [Verrucomicrobiales bacterium]|nr:hypothetical protein [Verrucomicrobiales bacterium]